MEYHHGVSPWSITMEYYHGVLSDAVVGEASSPKAETVFSMAFDSGKLRKLSRIVVNFRSKSDVLSTCSEERNF